ncbi:Thioredoxin-disulfide reductase [Flagellimonas maritima]|uniref:Thioredoxin-disulfide reductase n=1 Tax=Flagellimonas maritima TaxID=1383885 RepID=A0A2Z4LS50_9FLAO|nr:FAD-dependent oxidoreductase [Allomuricauda aurantiaca]AWX44404.1 Thioredoxin-disulfide reductase [Allomuricauda aurantiaca]
MNENLTNTKIVHLYGKSNSAKAYEIRDFLNRSVVAFKWIELNTLKDLKNAPHLKKEDAERLPIVELPDGTLLYKTNVEKVATHLGWISKPKHKEYDLSIYGAGPAGLSAAVYAASEGLRTVLIEKSAIGGQAGTSSLIENYMGFPNGIAGADLAERARQQAVKFGVEILMLREGVKAQFKNQQIHVNMADGEMMIANANICATGVEYRKLNLENEAKYLNKGVYYGAGASEAFLCEDKHIFIVGGGNSAGQAAMYFSKFAKKVSLIVRSGNLSESLSHYLLTRIEEKPNIEVLYNSEVSELIGENELKRIHIKRTQENTIEEYDTERLFICIGGIPNTEWAKDTDIIRDKSGYLMTGADLSNNGKFVDCWKLEREPFFLETSVPGSFAAGDVRHGSVKRVASSAGEGAMAVTFVHKYLENLHK